MKGPGHYLWAARHEYRLWRERRAQRARMLAFYRQFVRPGDLVFDVGANQGSRSEVFLALGARVVAVEPQSAMAAGLARRFGPRVTLVRKALGEAPGELELHLSDEPGIASMSPEWVRNVQESGRFTGRKWDRSERVPVTTFDALVEEHGLPAFTKIDVEGFEAHVLRGLSRALPAVSFEFTPENPRVLEECVRRLEALGTRSFNYSLGESMGLELPGWVDATRVLERLAALPKADWGDVYARSASS